jgi:cysteine desulfurase
MYFDHNSTTPVDPQVLEAMLPYFSQKFGNAASSTHAYGRMCSDAVEKAREQVAALIGGEPGEIIFTSGATESLNLAMRGAMAAYSEKGRHLVICATEHKAVFDTAADLEKQGAEVSILCVDREGRIDLGELESLLRDDTVLVAVMMANNETGVLQDSASVGELARAKQVLHLCDTTQALGKMRVDVNEHRIDLCSISGHKFYGPKGCGALYVRRKNPRVTLLPEMTGGGHERGLRAGTLNVPGIVGLGEACRLAGERLWEYGIHTSRWRTFFEQMICVEHKLGRINGSTRHRLPNTTNISFHGIRSRELMNALPELAFSAGSACSSAIDRPSHVLAAMGLTEDESRSSARFSFGIHTTEEEVNRAILRIGELLVRK